MFHNCPSRELFKMQRPVSALLAVGVLLCVGVGLTWACNEVVCASIVSKCMLTQACKCDLMHHPNNNCTCCNDCSKCLGYLYQECCSCLGMCEPREHDSELKDSQVGDIPEPFPQLFKAITDEKDLLLRWTSITFPIDVSVSDIEDASLDRSKYKLVSHPQDTVPADQVTVNCTVLYMAQCMSGRKCRSSCESTGASAYRWFFDGCCECVGSRCINYGVDESRCIDCPRVDDFDDELTDRILSGSIAPPTDESALQSDILFEDGPTN
ncbi:twisted gastrulation protein homolog 1-A-like isoform X1 [Penaeus indicus]|uniref:twisted gastrulation protein homolog 1-A-like isoform X1 n=1 Tax=Penaeus indicus TaxID=29960 RepID=UPI00300C5229